MKKSSQTINSVNEMSSVLDPALQEKQSQSAFYTSLDSGVYMVVPALMLS